MGVLRADTGVVEARRDRFSLQDLAELVLEKVRPHAVQDARDSSRPHRGPAGRFDADKLRRGADKACESARRVAASARHRPRRNRGAARTAARIAAGPLRR